ncbi:hypothetical protein Tco_1242581 [Tanacetum coccineum]
MAVLPSSRLFGESDLTMTKLSVFVTVRRPYLIVISKGTSPKGQEYSPKKPMSGTLVNIRSGLRAIPLENDNNPESCLYYTATTREEEFHLATTAQLIRLQGAIQRGTPEAEEMFKKMELTIEARNDVNQARKIVQDNLDGLGQDT